LVETARDPHLSEVSGHRRDRTGSGVEAGQHTCR
jgi:hypothetical protein